MNSVTLTVTIAVKRQEIGNQDNWQASKTTYYRHGSVLIIIILVD
jgi:hypothetical protein